VRPLNAMPSHALAAAAAIAIAGFVIASAYLAFDVGGVRMLLRDAFRARVNPPAILKTGKA
jgi:hypothetical protein